MKIGAVYPQIELRGDPEAVRRIGTSVETLGFDYLLAYDHVLGATHEGRGKEVFDGRRSHRLSVRGAAEDRSLLMSNGL
jgi:hypothetical protein